MKPQKQTLSPEEFLNLKKIATPSPASVSANATQDPILTPVPKQSQIWLPSTASFIGLSLILILTLGALLQVSLMEVYSYPLWQTWPKIWFILLGSIPVLVCVRILYLEAKTLIRFRSQEAIQAELKKLYIENDWGKALPVCRRLVENQAGSDEFSACITQAHSDSEIIDLMDRTVFSSMDQKAIAMIRQTAKETALFTMISPWAFVDALLMLFRQSHLLSQLCHIYHLRPGKIGFFALYASMVRDLALAGGSEILSDSISDIFGGSLVSKVSAKAGQGALTALLIARFGILAINRIRPLPLKQNPLPLPKLLSDIVLSLESPGQQKEK